MAPTFNIATALTWVRIAAIPLVVAAFYAPGEWSRPIACLIFTLAAITHAQEGYLARRLNQTSRFGAFLDPVADKLMVTVALIIIIQADPRIVIAATGGIIICREITISALREWMAEIGASSYVAVSAYGKLKTVMQMVGLGMMLWTRPVFGIPIYSIGLLLLIVAAGLTIWSMFGYLRSAWPTLRGSEGVS